MATSSAVKNTKPQKLDRVLRRHFASLKDEMAYVLALPRLEIVLGGCQTVYPSGKKSVRVRIRRTRLEGRRYFFEIEPLSAAQRSQEAFFRVGEYLPLYFGRRLAVTLGALLDRPEYDYEIDFIALGRWLERAMARKEREWRIRAPRRSGSVKTPWRASAWE